MTVEKRLARLLVNSRRLSAHLEICLTKAERYESLVKKLLEHLAKMKVKEGPLRRKIRKFLKVTKKYYDSILFPAEEDLAQILSLEFSDLRSLIESVKGDLIAYLKIDPTDEVGKTRLESIILEAKEEAALVSKELNATLEALSDKEPLAQLQEKFNISHDVHSFRKQLLQEKHIVRIDNRLVKKISKLLGELSLPENKEGDKQLRLENELHSTIAQLDELMLHDKKLLANMLRDALLVMQFELYIYDRSEQLIGLAKAYVDKVSADLPEGTQKDFHYMFKQFMEWKKERFSTMQNVILECREALKQS